MAAIHNNIIYIIHYTVLNSFTFLLRERKEKLLIRLLHRDYMYVSLPLHQVGVPEKKHITGANGDTFETLN